MVVNAKISPFFWNLNNVLGRGSCKLCFSEHRGVSSDFIPLDEYPDVGLLDHIVLLICIFLGGIFSIFSHNDYINFPQIEDKVPFSLHPCYCLQSFDFLIIVVLTDMSWQLFRVLIYSFSDDQ